MNWIWMKTFLYRESEPLCIVRWYGAQNYQLTRPLKKKTTTLKSLIKMRQMTLNDPKFDIKKSLDTLLCLTTKIFWRVW